MGPMLNVNILIVFTSIICFRVSITGWISGQQKLPHKDQEMAVGVWNGTIILLGEYDGKQQLTEIDTVTKTVTDVGSTLTANKNAGSGQYWTQIQHIIYMIESKAPQLNVYNMIDRTYTTNWMNIVIPINPDYSACLASDSWYLYITGGYNDIHEEMLNTLQILNISTQTWLDNPASMTQRREAHACVVHNDYLWIFGGFDGSSQISKTERILTTDIVSHTWDNTIDELTVAVEYVRCSPYYDIIYVIGGYSDNKRHNIVHLIDANTGEVSVSPDRMPYGTALHSPIIWDNVLYVFGGFNSDGYEPSDDWAYYPLAAPPTANPTVFPSSASSTVFATKSLTTEYSARSTLSVSFISTTEIPTDPTNDATSDPSNEATDAPSTNPIDDTAESTTKYSISLTTNDPSISSVLLYAELPSFTTNKPRDGDADGDSHERSTFQSVNDSSMIAVIVASICCAICCFSFVFAYYLWTQGANTKSIQNLINNIAEKDRAQNGVQHHNIPMMQNIVKVEPHIVNEADYSAQTVNDTIITNVTIGAMKSDKIALGIVSTRRGSINMNNESELSDTFNSESQYRNRRIDGLDPNNGNNNDEGNVMTVEGDGRYTKNEKEIEDDDIGLMCCNNDKTYVITDGEK